MKQHPILFQAEMVRAILSGSKGQTRRIADVEDATGAAPGLITPKGSFAPRSPKNHLSYYKYQAGEQLWVRETWRAVDKSCAGLSNYWSADQKNHRPDLKPSELIQAECCILYRASIDLHSSPHRWKPSIFMPRWASRITLNITGIRLEKLHDISEADAINEGIEKHSDGEFVNYMLDQLGGNYHSFDCPIKSYFSLWEKINGKESLESNPWVWVTEFKRVEGEP